ncbi:hypothetical protein Tco_1064996 [Tanacetum coccineum]
MRMRLFQFSLRDQARNWLEHIPAGSIPTWEDLTTPQYNQYNDHEMTAKAKEKVEEESEDEFKEKATKNEEDELAGVSSSYEVRYYMKYRIDEKLIEGLVENQKFNDSCQQPE